MPLILIAPPSPNKLHKFLPPVYIVKTLKADPLKEIRKEKMIKP